MIAWLLLVAHTTDASIRLRCRLPLANRAISPGEPLRPSAVVAAYALQSASPRTSPCRTHETAHMKADGKLDRNWLKGALGDAIHAVLCGAGHNLRMILRKLRLFYAFVLIALLSREITAVFAA